MPLVATNDVHYRRKEDAESHDVLLCIQTNKKLSDQDRIRFQTQEFYFKSGAEMADLFPEAPEAIETTVPDRGPVRFQLPRGPFPAQLQAARRHDRSRSTSSGSSREGFAERAQGARARRRPRASSPIRSKSTSGGSPREIRLIKQMGFEGYFLIVWDLIRTARTAGIPVGPGRGSAAGSLLAYCLGITDIDPLEYDLLFERFLNPERISLPDIDIDFCARRREEVIEYVTEKYGQDNVSQIITFGTMAARAAIRDVGRVLDVPLPEVDRIAKMIPFGTDVTIEKALDGTPQLKELRDKNPKIAHLLEIARKVEGQVRHPSIHAAGIVITPRPLAEFLPALQVVEGRDHDPVRDEGRRGHRPAEDGPPRPAQPDRHRRRPGPDQEGPRRNGRPEDHPDRRQGDVRPLPGGGRPTASSSSRAGA